MGNFDHYAYGNFELFSSFSSSVQTVLELIIHWSYIRGGGPLNNVLSGGATSTHSPSYPIPSNRDQEQVFTCGHRQLLSCNYYPVTQVAHPPGGTDGREEVGGLGLADSLAHCDCLLCFARPNLIRIATCRDSRCGGLTVTLLFSNPPVPALVGGGQECVKEDCGEQPGVTILLITQDMKNTDALMAQQVFAA